jgi:hypothetical protein
MKKPIVLIAVVLGFAVLHAQTPNETDLTHVLMGLIHAMELPEYSSGESGRSLDSSLSWTRDIAVTEIPRDENPGHKNFTKEIRGDSFLFNGYGFCLLPRGRGGRHRVEARTITLDGNIALSHDEYSLDGKLSVRGTDSVRSIAFNGFAIDGEGGTVLVNGQAYDAELLRDILGDVDWQGSEVFDADKESAFVFFALFVSLFATDISSVLESLGEAAQNRLPPGLAASNPQKTLTVTTQTNRLDMKFADFVFDGKELSGMSTGSFPFNPLINGAVSMGLNLTEYDFESIVYDGAVTIRNTRFVTRIEFESCTLTDNERDFSGNIVVNGERSAFSQFLSVIKSIGSSLF